MKYPFINYISNYITKQWPKIPYTCYKLPRLRKMKEMPNIAIKYLKMHLDKFINCLQLSLQKIASLPLSFIEQNDDDSVHIDVKGRHERYNHSKR
jgi:hypothetical protein